MNIKGPSVELINLSLQLNRVTLLESLSAHFQPGRMHAITGPNGAGKSSLIKCLLGLMPHSGQIRRHWPGRPGNIAYVPQQSAFEPSLPVTIEEFMLTSVSRWPMFFKRRVAEQQRISGCYSGLVWTINRICAWANSRAVSVSGFCLHKPWSETAISGVSMSR
ncbi:ATP-binding cassette domain-containing protein [Nitrincola sp. A-D6]|uniref:ATP-binding cassette domain-containing protein n=1 Tax=Nitrincola sp. A-D6 TaxID=1545442 RepID=UPI00068A522B|nr:ATP-binding cassette domain-containing protein [Nitrincola sp. A-D6]